MKQDNWDSAARKLLHAAGVKTVKSEKLTIETIAPLLHGTGLSFKRIEIINGTVPLKEDVIGGIVGNQGTQGLAFLCEHMKAYVIPANDSEQVRGLSQQDLKSDKHVWLLERETDTLASIPTFLRRNFGRFVDLLLCALVINVFALLMPLFSSFVYDKILGNGIVDTLWALVVGIGIALCIDFCIRMVRVSLAEQFSVRCETDIDYTIFRNLIDISANKLPSIGSLLEKYKQILSYRDFLSSSYLMSLADVPFLVLFLFVIAFVAGPIVFVSIVCGLILLAVSVFLMPYELDNLKAARVTSERRLALMTDVLTSRDAVIGSFFRNDLTNRWRQESVATATSSSQARFWRGLSGNIANIVSSVSFVAVIVCGVYLLEAHKLTSGGLLAASMLTTRAVATMSSLVMLILRYKEFNMALRELNTILPSALRTHSGISYGRLKGDIRVDSVVCRLKADDKPVLTAPKIEIKAGEIVGIAGAPGAGKSTLLRLIAGVLTPDEGRILIDNIPVLRISHEDMGINIGFKPQELCLLEGSIEDSIRAGRHGLATRDMQEVLETSGLSFAFKESGLNWKTEVGARGSQLSGGQRQLVAIARAMVGKPSILMLDEPTNGLDAPLEAHFAKQIEALRGKSTILICTHSRAMLQICDHIIVVGQGRILADGPREKILVQ